MIAGVYIDRLYIQYLKSMEGIYNNNDDNNSADHILSRYTDEDMLL